MLLDSDSEHRFPQLFLDQNSKKAWPAQLMASESFNSKASGNTKLGTTIVSCGCCSDLLGEPELYVFGD